MTECTFCENVMLSGFESGRRGGDFARQCYAARHYMRNMAQVRRTPRPLSMANRERPVWATQRPGSLQQRRSLLGRSLPVGDRQHATHSCRSDS